MGIRSYVEIEYVDYLVARNFIDTVSEWMDGIERFNYSKFHQFIFKKSHWAPRVISSFLGAVAIYNIFNFAPIFVNNQQPDLELIFYFSFISLIAVILIYQLGEYIGDILEGTLDEMQFSSIFAINKGDEKLHAEIKKSRKANKIKLILNFVGTIFLSFVGSFLANLIK